VAIKPVLSPALRRARRGAGFNIYGTLSVSPTWWGRGRAAGILVCFLLILAPGLRPGVLFAQNASLFGYTGLMVVPSAEIADDGELTAGVSRIPMLYTNWHPNRRTVMWGRMGFLPFLEAGGMFVRPDHYIGGFGDRSVYLRVRLLREKGWRPAVTVGTQDFFAIKQLKWETATAQHFGALYLVASRHDTLRGVPLHFHLGYGPDWLVARTKMLVGLFGGVSYSPHRMVTLLAEYDAECFNAGLRLQPFPFLQAHLGLWKLKEVTANLAFTVHLQ